MLRERSAGTAVLPTGESLPFYYKLAALAVFHTRRAALSAAAAPSFAVAAAPLLVSGAVLAGLYAHPLLIARTQHKHLVLHLLAVLASFFVYLNALLACVVLCPGAEPLLAVLCALHLLNATETSLTSPAYDSLLPAQDAVILLLYMLKLMLAPAVWLLTAGAHAEMTVDTMVYCLFTPEALGLLLQTALSQL